MADFRRVTDRLSVSPQIQLADVARAAGLGFTTLICNRPDGEEPGQPASAEVEAAARSAGLSYIHIPVRGGPTPEQAQAQAAAVAASPGPVLAFCRSGTRSITAWSLGELAGGARPRDEILALAAAAGYDLSAALPG